ncbi:hypothetical protein [Lentilactobacillus parabuchneri]|uniref:hypothetical protein n=1 Tax=Lentilactobacillus parabuchneri TaxID=152331 RepID=UPI000A10C162|nr:hypothetical protein [Lentilactobacillus parabuchneri]ORN12744.1 hypothetical protein FAM23164_02372 [Lentilactobacillus parabuchneri]ORN14634.1 hypothetical protein FAM23165_02380 [Lentilactobacillus parabuchneri]ORN17546.1 hypothetical protein FAM23166_02357 [Lentilactobacillus parabuchneri]ORN23928.1 hypothetical protein FAM23167_02142 [Lentilactobacillus parabuchneri]
MATPNVGILTNAGKNLIDQVNAGQTKITFSKIVFSSMNNNQLTDDQIKVLTTVAPQEVVINNPEVTLDNGTGETRIRATGNNKALDDGVYVKTYAVYAKNDSGNEILYGITVSPNPNYLPEYDGVTPQAVTYSYKVNISNTSNITFTNSNDIYVSDTDLAEALQPYAKTVDVNQQLDKKVNVADMRKPASDVAGIEEVNAKQDKIGYTPADDSKVVHVVDMVNSDVYGLQIISSGSANDLPKGTIFCTNAVTDLPNKTDAWTIRTTYADVWGARRTQIAIADSADLMFYRTCQSGISGNYGDWKQLLTADQLPPDLARTGQAQTFTAAQTFSIAPTIKDASKDKGDNQAATMADLKSVEESAWRVLDQSNAPSNISFRGQVLYKIDDAKKIIYFTTNGLMNISDSGYNLNLINFKGIVNNLLSGHGRLASVSNKTNIRDSDISATSTYVKNSEWLDTAGNLVSYGDPGQNYAYVIYDSLVNN